VLAAWVAWIPESGGYFPRDWYPVALALTFLVGVMALVGTSVIPATKPARWALGALGALVAWSLASMLWAGSRGSAWEAASQLLLYAVIAWVVAVTPWTPRSASLFLGAWSLAVAGACAFYLLRALGASNLGDFIYLTRWDAPIGYANATAGLASMAFFVALMLSTWRRTPAALQIAFLALAVFLIEFSLIPQSRGSMVATVGALAVLFALTPARLSLLARVAVVAGALVMTLEPIFNVYTAAREGHAVSGPLHHSARLMIASIVLSALAGLVIVLVERFAPPPPTLIRTTRIAVGSVLVLVALGGAALAIGESGRISRYVSHRWGTFKTNVSRPDPAGPRILGDPSDKRYDYWRVALNALRGSPLEGIGSGNFEHEYTVHRRFEKPSRYPHDVWLRVLSETGAIGAAAFLGFLALALGGLVRARARLAGYKPALVATCVVVPVYFLIHASVDWLDALPALAAPAFALPFVGLALVDSSAADSTDSHEPGPARRRITRVGLVAVAAAGFTLLAFPYLSARYVDRAFERWRSDPASAFRNLDRAARLNPVSPEPELAAGTIAVTLRRDSRATRAFRRALTVEDGWYPHFELALLASQAGRFSAAAAQITRASALNPKSPLVKQARSLIGRRTRFDPVAFNRQVLDQPLYKREDVH
jgi:hypothetical protein